MSIVIKCTGCGKQYKVRDDLAGKRVKCKCGQAMVVPAPAPEPEPEPEPDAYDLAPMGGSDPSSLLDEDPPPTAAGPAPPRAAVPPPAKKPVPAREPVRKAAKKGGGSTLAARLGPVAVMLGLMAVPVVLILGFIWLVTRPGFGSPEEAFAAHQEALLLRDWDGLIATYTPESQEMFLDRMLENISYSWGAFDEPSPDIEAVLKEYGLEKILPEVISEEDAEEGGADSAETAAEEEDVEIDYEEYARKAEEAAKEREKLRKRLLDSVEDKAALYSDLNDAIEAMVEKSLPENPVLAIMTKKPVEEARRHLARVDLDDLEADGASAEGSMTFKPIGEGKEITVPVKFKKVGGRWYLHTPGLDHFDQRSFRCLFGGGWI